LLQEIRQEINQAKQKSGFGGAFSTKRIKIDEQSTKAAVNQSNKEDQCENPFMV
jgi:hypothetical protein